MKVGDKVVALQSLWIDGYEEKLIIRSVGTVCYDREHFVDVAFPEGKAVGCDPGRHVELEVLVNSPLAKALK